MREGGGVTQGSYSKLGGDAFLELCPICYANNSLVRVKSIGVFRSRRRCMSQGVSERKGYFYLYNLLSLVLKSVLLKSSCMFVMLCKLQLLKKNKSNIK